MNLQSYRVPLLIVALGAVLSFLAFQWDHPIREHLLGEQGDNWQKTTEAKVYGKIRVWGDWPPIMVAGAIGFVIAKLRGSRRWSRILLAAMLASTLAGMVANASRLTTGRTRPRESPKIEQGFYGPYHHGRFLIGVPAYNSFPSGHTATAFGFAAVIAITSPVWGLPALAAAGVVAWSSVVIGAHHPSDVAVSITLSFLVAWIVCRIMRPGIRFEPPPNSEPPLES
ncbi:MAG: phosphatase PAP2 family protein [bacterium]